MKAKIMEKTEFESNARKLSIEAIAKLKEMLPDVYTKIQFLDDADWFEDNYKKSRMRDTLIKLRELEKCKECLKADKSRWGTQECPGMTPYVNIPVSNSYKDIRVDYKECLYRRKVEKQDKIKRYLQECGVTIKHLDNARLELFQPGNNQCLKDCLRMVKDYLSNYKKYLENGTGLIFHGNIRCGKTHLAVGTTVEIAERYCVPFQYCHVPALMSQLKADSVWHYDDVEENEDRSGYRKISYYAKYPHLLILDALGNEMPESRTVSALNAIIQGRCDNCNPTIVTTRFSPEQEPHVAKSRTGGATASPIKTLHGVYDRWGEVGCGIPEMLCSVCAIVNMQDAPSFKKQL